MRASELFARCGHTALAAGQTPSIQTLEAEIDSSTFDWRNETEQRTTPRGSIPKAIFPELGGEDSNVHCSVLKFWDLFSKTEDNSIIRAHYEDFIGRVAAVFLPGFSTEEEKSLAINCWEEATKGATRLTFALFFRALVRLARTWSDSDHPDELFAFLEDLLARTTRLRITDHATGEVTFQRAYNVVTFWKHGGNGDVELPPNCDFGTTLAISCSGTPENISIEVSTEESTIGNSFNYCFYQEHATQGKAAQGSASENAAAREWVPKTDVIPLGYAALRLLEQIKADAAQGALEVDASATGITEIQEAAAAGLRAQLPNSERLNAEVIVDGPEATVIEDTEIPVGVGEIIGIGMAEGISRHWILVRPHPRSLLWKLDNIRRNLHLKQTNAALASSSKGTATAPLVLPSFSDVLSGEALLGPLGVIKPVHKTTLLEFGSLASIAEAFVMQASAKEDTDKDVADAAAPNIQYQDTSAFTRHFPSAAENLFNDPSDILGLAQTSPLALWVMGQCDSSGEYKTEVCRRLAEKLGLQWLQPAHMLELAVKTPLKRRTPVMKRCVEQLQRGMTVSISDSLRLTMEMMSSALCKTNGYILDIPPVTQEEAQEISAFARKVQSLSGSNEVRWQEVIQDDVELPPLAPEPEPPKPPPAEDDVGDAPVDPDAAADDTPAPAAEGLSDEIPVAVEEPTVGDEAPAEEQEEVEPPPPPPLPPMVPNPLANAMPRRLVVLSMEQDEVANWRLAVLKAEHEAKERRRRELEAQGDELPEEEEDEVEELPTIPQEEEEQDELFQKEVGDILRTMAPFLTLPSLNKPKKLPPIPDLSQEVQPEMLSREVLKKGEDRVVKALQQQLHLPVLSLHVDGRPPEVAADLLEVVTGKIKGFRAPLPLTIEGGADEPKELLTAGLGERQPPRRLSPWKLVCPVSLSEKQLLPGEKEFAVDYAGYVFLCADATKQRRFCNWPKHFLSQAPRINLEGMCLGWSLLSPCGYHSKELAQRLEETYGFTIVNIVTLIERALRQPPLHEEPLIGEDGAELEEVPVAAPGEPSLTLAEHQALISGKPISTNTAIRLIAWALGIERNLELIRLQQEELASARKALEDAKAAGTDPPADIRLNEEGEPIVDFLEPLHRPSRGFILEGFPETSEQFQALQTQLRLSVEQVLILKAGEEGPDTMEQLEKAGLGAHLPLQPLLEAQLANFEGIAAIESLKIVDVSLEAPIDQKFVQIRKLIDPFYPVVEDSTCAMTIPDPDEWTPEEVDPSADGDAAEPQERPVIPWGTCGIYCPVTLKDHFWLCPGLKEFQHVYGNRVFAMAAESASEAFLREPVRYVPSEREPTIPPPRILVTGPTGSGVDKQCTLLSKAYKIPVLKLESTWREKLEHRLKALRAERKAAARREALEQAMLNEGNPVWPEGWAPAEAKAPEDEDDAEPPPPEPEDDGLDDEGREAQFVLAMQDALGAHCGACIMDGSWFSDLDDEEMGEDVRSARSLQNLLTKARRLPDLSIILRCKNDIAARNTFNFEEIDREHEAKVAAYRKLVEEAEAKEEDPPEQPADLVIDDEEKESDRVKAKFIEKKQAQQQLLKDFAEALVSARAPHEKVSSDRGEEATLKSIRWHCRPFMEQRASLLLRHQIQKAQPSLANELLQRGLAQPSRFEEFNPLFTDAPTFPGRANAKRFAALLRGRISYPHSQAELDQLLERPSDFFHLPAPSRITVNPAIAIVGPPLSGKTALAKDLAQRTGAVYISLPEVITEIIATTSMPFQLSKDILAVLKRGGSVPAQAAAEALRFRLASPDVLARGWILDDFPSSIEQAKALSTAGIVPHRLLVINVPESQIFLRAKELMKRHSDSNEASVLLQQESHMQRQRLKAYEEKSPSVRAYYGRQFDNVRDVDGSRTAWAVFDRALQETTESVKQRLQYYRRTSSGFAARIHGLGFTPERLASITSPWHGYCPVALTLGNELVCCQDPKFAVEYKFKVYWPSSEDYAEHFTADPESFLQVPLPKALPKALSFVDSQALFDQNHCELEDYCPVALVDRKDTVKGSGYYVVEFQTALYNLENKQAVAKFLRRPMRYVQRAKLPSKTPAIAGEQNLSLLSALTKGRETRGLEPSDMLTYMQASVAELICQALVDAGERRPLYPGKTPQESALLYVTRFLKARNPVNTEMYAEFVKGQREEFLTDCELPSLLKEMIQRKDSAQDIWTATDSAKYQELCARFDEVFHLK